MSPDRSELETRLQHLQEQLAANPPLELVPDGFGEQVLDFDVQLADDLSPDELGRADPDNQTIEVATHFVETGSDEQIQRMMAHFVLQHSLDRQRHEDRLQGQLALAKLEEMGEQVDGEHPLVVDNSGEGLTAEEADQIPQVNVDEPDGRESGRSV